MPANQLTVGPCFAKMWALLQIGSMIDRRAKLNMPDAYAGGDAHDCAATFKAFLQMRLNIHGVFGLSQDLQKVITGQEVEARELLALVLQVVF